MTEKLANDTIEGVNYLLQQEDRLPIAVMVKVSTLFEAEKRIIALGKRVKELEDRETMAIRLLEQSKPYVDEMLGVSLSVRILSPQIGYFLEGTLVLED